MPRICSWHECRNPLDTARGDARFCSDNCRAKANKAKHRAANGPAVQTAPASTPVAQPQRAAPSTAEPPGGTVKKWSREDFSFSADQGDYNPGERDVIPATPVGRIARLEDRLHDMEQDFDLAEPERRTWERLRPKVEALLAVGKSAAPMAPVPAAAAGLTADQVSGIVRTEVNGILKSWRERILQHDSQIAELRGEVEQLAERVKATKKADLAIAPPPVAAGGTDKRVVAKLTELEAAVEGTRERLDAVESDVAEAWQAIFRQASGANDEDEDEDDDAA